MNLNDLFPHVKDMNQLESTTWMIELHDGETYEFYISTDQSRTIEDIQTDFTDECDPNTYAMDIDELTHIYPTSEEDDSFVLIPKSHVTRIFKLIK